MHSTKIALRLSACNYSPLFSLGESERRKRWCGICQGSQGQGLKIEKNKINKQQFLTNKPRRKSLRTNKLRGELILGRTWTDDKGSVCYCANILL